LGEGGILGGLLAGFFLDDALGLDGRICIPSW
jgi:hypothetical protein